MSPPPPPFHSHQHNAHKNPILPIRLRMNIISRTLNISVFRLESEAKFHTFMKQNLYGLDLIVPEYVLIRSIKHYCLKQSNMVSTR
jgi:hypothetical protein